MNSRIEVTVTLDDQTDELSLSDPSITLEDGDWVEWKFDGTLPTDSVLFILFDDNPGVGPFQRLRFFSPHSVLGFGNVGQREQNSYTYEALLLGPDGLVAKAPDPGMIANEASANSSPNARVIITPNDPAPEDPENQFRVVIEPEHLTLVQGEAAIWQVEGLGLNQFINLKYSGLSAADTLGGPFQTYSLAADGDTPLIFAYGFNFNDQVPVGQSTSYRIEVRENATGTVVGSHDPQIDNLGPPLPPTTILT